LWEESDVTHRSGARQFILYEACLVCGCRDRLLLATAEQVRGDEVYREQLFRAAFSDGTPDFILEDHVYFSHNYLSALVTCRYCGMVYRDPRLAPDHTIEEYTDYEYHPEWMESALRLYADAYRDRAREIAGSAGGGKRVIEVGSHVGGFLEAARQVGMSAGGVDVGRCVSSFARAHGLDVLTGTLADARLPSASVDVLVNWLCFEAVPDPWRELVEVHRVLKPGGLFYLSVPNAAAVSMYFRTRAWLPSRLRHTVTRWQAYSILLGFPFQLAYTGRSLRFLLDQSGFDVLRLANDQYTAPSSPKYARPELLRDEQWVCAVAHLAAEAVRELSAGRRLLGAFILATARKRT
jgi:SAM-dependent methyltransferase